MKDLHKSIEPAKRKKNNAMAITITLTTTVIRPPHHYSPLHGAFPGERSATRLIDRFHEGADAGR